MPNTAELVALFKTEGEQATANAFKSMGRLADQAGSAFDRAGGAGVGMFKSIASTAAGFLTANVIGKGFDLATGAISGTISKGAEFQTTLSKIQATSGASGAELAQLRKLALDLGAANDVGAVSAKGAADAIFEMQKAGMSTEQILGGAAKSVLQLSAAAGDMAPDVAAGFVADSLNTFKDQGLKAADAVNTLVGAANASSIGLNELRQSLAAVGPVADQIGMSFRDFNVAMAEFGMHGLKGSDAGTSLKTMLLNLQPSTKPAIAVFKELGILTKNNTNLFFDQHGKVKSLAEIQEILRTHTAKLTAEQRINAFQTMFGTDAVRAAAIMAQEGSKGYGDMAAAMQKQGNAAAAASTMNANLKGSWDSLMGTLETGQIQLEGMVDGPLKGLIDTGNALAADAINGNWGQFADDFGANFGTMGRAVSNFAKLIGNEGVLQGALDGLPGVWEAARGSLIQGVTEVFGDAAGGKAGMILDKVGEWGGNLASGVFFAIRDNLPKMQAFAGSFGGQIIDMVFGDKDTQQAAVDHFWADISLLLRTDPKNYSDIRESLHSTWAKLLDDSLKEGAKPSNDTVGQFADSLYAWILGRTSKISPEMKAQLGANLATVLGEAAAEGLTQAWKATPHQAEGIGSFLHDMWGGLIAATGTDKQAADIKTWADSTAGAAIAELNKAIFQMGRDNARIDFSTWHITWPDFGKLIRDAITYTFQHMGTPTLDFLHWKIDWPDLNKPINEAAAPLKAAVDQYNADQAAAAAKAKLGGADTGMRPDFTVPAATSYPSDNPDIYGNDNPYGLAGGGTAVAGRLYRVNERGREWFRPSITGEVVPMGGAAGGGGGTINILPGAIVINSALGPGNRIADEVAARLFDAMVEQANRLGFRLLSTRR